MKKNYKAIVTIFFLTGILGLLPGNSSGQSISGPTTVCVGQNPAIYSFNAPQGASVLGWDVIGGTPGPGSLSINVNWTTATPVGRVTVRYSIGGEPQNPETFPVVVYPSGGTLAAGTISAPAAVCYNGAATLGNAVSASGGGFERYFWWKRLESDPFGWALIDGIIGDTYTANFLTEPTYFYRAASFQCGQVNSNMVLVNVYPPLSGGTISQPQPVCQASAAGYIYNASLASGGTGSHSYQWQRSTDGIFWTDMTAETNPASVHSGNLTGPTWFRRKVVSCNTAYSNMVLMSISPPLAAGTISGAGHFCESNLQPVEFTGTAATGGNGTYTYQWQQIDQFGGWADIWGATGINYNTSSPGYYRRSDTGCNDTKWTNSVSIVADQMSSGGDLGGGYEAYGTASSGGSVSSLYVLDNVGPIVRWESQVEGSSTWVPISSASTTYNFTNITQTTSFRVVAKNGVCPEAASLVPVKVKIYPIPYITVEGPTILSYGSGTGLSTQNCPTCNAFPYVWYKDNVVLGSVGGPNISVIEPGTYKVKVMASTLAGEYTTDPVTISPLSGQSGVNYRSVTRIRKAGVLPTTSLHTLLATDFQQTIEYQDGLGRPIQTQSIGQAPGYKDIIAPASYDNFGRATKQFLPYANGNYRGTYTPNAITGVSGYASSEQYSFYQNQLTKVARDTEPYSITVYDNTPLGRVLKQGAPGTAWQPDANPQSLADKTVKNRFLVNAASEVLLFTYNATDGSVSATTGSVAAYYGPGQLAVSKTYDENNNEVITYTDKEGKLILKKVQYGKDAGNNPLYGSTYYVYNDYGNLVVVLPPEAINSMGILFTQN